jgi:hypothetical protein
MAGHGQIGGLFLGIDAATQTLRRFDIQRIDTEQKIKSPPDLFIPDKKSFRPDKFGGKGSAMVAAVQRIFIRIEGERSANGRT